MHPTTESPPPAPPSGIRIYLGPILLFVCGFAVGASYFAGLFLSGEVQHEEVLFEGDAPSRSQRKKTWPVDFAIDLQADDAAVTWTMERSARSGAGTAQALELEYVSPSGTTRPVRGYTEGGSSFINLLTLQTVEPGTHRMHGEARWRDGTTRLAIVVHTRAWVPPIWIVFVGVGLCFAGGIWFMVTGVRQGVQTMRYVRQSGGS